MGTQVEKDVVVIGSSCSNNFLIAVDSSDGSSGAFIVVSSNDDFNSSGSSDFNGSDTGGDKFGRITWLRVRGSQWYTLWVDRAVLV